MNPWPKDSEQSPALKEVLKLLAMDKLPDNAEEIMERLESEAYPSEADFFGDFWEALYAAL